MPEDFEAFRVLEADEIRRTKDGMREDAESILTRLSSNRVCYETADFPVPAGSIVDYVDNHSCDLAIMGRRGRSGLRGLLGSVATSTQKKVDASVMTVK